jgi:putative acetyltransferase
VVIGHPTFYPKFGFVPASTTCLEYEHPVRTEAFMVLELQAGALAHTRGVVRYRPEFTKA